MSTAIPIRLASLVATVAIFAGACSSAGTQDSEGLVFDPPSAPETTAPASTTRPEPSPTVAPSPSLGTDIEAAVAALVPPGSPGAIVRVELGGSTVLNMAVGEVGFDNGSPLTVEHPFRLASTTKPITAATVLRLQEQGRLDIDDLIADYLPSDLVSELHVVDGVSRGGDITIRHLLAHRSGLADRPFDTPFIEDVGNEPGRVWEPRELVKYGITHSKPRFEPGADFYYSDDGYVLLGMIIEAATGQPLHQVYREQVLDPLGMDGTYLEGHEPARGLELSHPYINGVDGMTIHPSTDWGGGGLVSTAADLTTFGAAIRDGTLFERPETGDEMLRDSGTGYGLGLFITPLGSGLTALAHDGFWGSLLLIIPELDVVMAATMNQFVDEEIREAFFFGVFDLMQQAFQEPPRPEQVMNVEVGGRTAAYVSDGSGAPTVVLEAGFGDGMESWAAIHQTAAVSTTVFAYDRAGYGDSEAVAEPRDGMHFVEELRTVLAASGHKPPFVLVGHSIGGLYMELFARTYPDEVVGLVLVDGTPATYFEQCIAALGAAACGPFDDEISQMPEPFRSEAQSIPTTEQQVLAAVPLGQIPAVVIASPHSDDVSGSNAIWIEAQREQAAALSATFVVAEDSGHYIQFDQPDLVLDAIESLVEQYRSGSS